MSLHQDLRDQARHLALCEPRRPLQASLRRAVSTAYYALFHLLIEEATGLMLGKSGARRSFRNALARSFSHGSMVGACKSFGSGTLPASIVSATGGIAVPADLRAVALTFVKLQDERHRADYNLAVSFRRSEVLTLIQALDNAISAWTTVRSHEVARFFLMTLPLWDQLRRAG